MDGSLYSDQDLASAALSPGRLGARASQMNMPGWSAKAACLEADPELFFPNGEGKSSWPQIAEAKAVCEACPVRGYCLDFALRTDAQYGIWAGTTPRDRQSIRRAGNYCGRHCGRAARPTWKHEIEIGIARHPDGVDEGCNVEPDGACVAVLPLLETR